jgi:hypothetical protein
MRSFTCGPNEAPGRSLVVWSFTCGPNEAPSRSLVTWPWVFVCGFMLLKCIGKLYGSHGILCSFIMYILKSLCCVILSNLSDYCKEDDFDQLFIYFLFIYCKEFDSLFIYLFFWIN